MSKGFASIHKKDFNSLKDFGVTISHLHSVFSNFPKTISPKEEEKKVRLFVRGFQLFFKTFRLWKTLIKTEKNAYVLKSAFYFLFFHYLNNETKHSILHLEH